MNHEARTSLDACPKRHATEGRDVVICVLGCPVRSRALARRAKAAADVFLAREGTLLLACGGRAWSHTVEADELARLLEGHGVRRDAIVRERCSLDTRDNARFATALLRRRGLSHVVLVTCTWHLPRAARLFRAAGLEVEGVGVDPPPMTLLQRAYFRVREQLSSWKDERRPMRIV